MCLVLFLSHCSVRKPFMFIKEQEKGRVQVGQPNQLASAPLSYSQTNVFCGYSCCHTVLSAVQDKVGPESPSREPSLPKGNRSIGKQLTSPCVRLLFSSIIGLTASYPGAMHMAPYPCTGHLQGAPST